MLPYTVKGTWQIRLRIWRCGGSSALSGWTPFPPRSPKKLFVVGPWETGLRKNDQRAADTADGRRGHEPGTMGESRVEKREGSELPPRAHRKECSAADTCISSLRPGQASHLQNPDIMNVSCLCH